MKRTKASAKRVPERDADKVLSIFPTYTMENLLYGSYKTEEFLVDKCLVAGQPCIVGGPEKSLKTCLMLDLGVSLATGRDFLGAMEVLRPCNVLLMSGESGLATLKKNFRTIYRARCCKPPRRRHGIPKEDGTLRLECVPKRLTLSDAVPLISDPHHLAEVKMLMEKHETDVLIIDTVSVALAEVGVSAPNMMIMQATLRGLSDICRDMGATVVLVHHYKKRSKPNQPPTLADLAYSGFKEFVRQWILVARSEVYKPPQEASKNRIHDLWLNCGGSAGHSMLDSLKINEGSFRKPRWEIELQSVTDAELQQQAEKAKTQLHEDSKALLIELKKCPTGETGKVLQEKIKRNWPRVEAALEHLLESGGIEKVSVVKRNRQSYDGYRLVQKAP